MDTSCSLLPSNGTTSAFTRQVRQGLQPQQSQRRAQRGRSTQQRVLRITASASDAREVTLLDYGAGNVRSVRNAITTLGFKVKDVERPEDILNAQRLIFPGVGSFGQAAKILKQRGYGEPLKEYVMAGRPFFGICLGLQLLFDGSDESGGEEGLGIVPGVVRRFDNRPGLPVPHIGWNTIDLRRPSPVLGPQEAERVYYVHSYRALPSQDNADWVLATTTYGEEYVGAINKGEVYATQFHPEKSGRVGLEILRAFLDPTSRSEQQPASSSAPSSSSASNGAPRGLAKRVIACLDVRANDQGDLVVTKGDQYDVRESTGSDSSEVRNLGLPVELAERYFQEGADEVSFLNITGFRDFPLGDLPMLEVLREASKGVFVPLTVGGGIRDFTDGTGKHYSALEVASEYFRSGADKVSIGSDAVDAAEAYYASGGQKSGTSGIEQISEVYGAQAVVVSIDPRRVWVSDPSSVKHHTVKASTPGPNGEQYCWWQCTVRGGREGRDIGSVEVAQAVEALGAGEILLNCIDMDGTGKGFDLDLVGAVSSAVSIPVIASSGAGSPQHFNEVFEATGASAALAAGIFHRREVPISAVKDSMAAGGIPTRT